ncbi:MAG: hypothetical protein EOP88_18640 [Verrucomicrobiaceae bacterium]|nr:MAG: hypothetical protein EOP88_18640 [Verrucomicrobiaceae bacterium]
MKFPTLCLFLTLVSAALTNCATSPKVFKSPTGNLRLVHDDGSAGGEAAYRIYYGAIRQPGEVKSLVNAADVRNVPGLPVDQKILWSPTGSTALIYENMSDASPEYQHVLVREVGDRKITVDKVDLGRRGGSIDSPYGEWPTVTGITDAEITLEWSSQPKVEKVSISRF